MQDGATATFDLFEPVGDHRTGGSAFYQDLSFSLPLAFLFAAAIDYFV